MPFMVTYQGTAVMVPSTPPVIGNTQGWLAGGTYGPNVIRTTKRSHAVTIVLAGYHTPNAKDGRLKVCTGPWGMVTSFAARLTRCDVSLRMSVC